MFTSTLRGLGIGSKCFISGRMRNSIKFPIWLLAFGVTERALRRDGDGLILRRIADWIAASQEVQGAVVMALDGVMDERGEVDAAATEIYVDNDFVAQEVARNRGLYYAASINPLRRNAVELLDKAKEQGAVYIKWLPAVQMFDPEDPRCDAFYKRLAELDMPLLSHVGDEDSFTITCNEYSDPRRLERALQMGVRVIAPHMASSGQKDGKSNFDHLVAMMRRFPNLYADVSALTQHNRKHYLAPALNDPLVRDRLLYGTDHPLSRTPLVAPLQYGPKIGWGKAWHLQWERNPFDRDLRLKRALGMDDAIFRRAATLLRIK